MKKYKYMSESSGMLYLGFILLVLNLLIPILMYFRAPFNVADPTKLSLTLFLVGIWLILNIVFMPYYLTSLKLIFFNTDHLILTEESIIVPSPYFLFPSKKVFLKDILDIKQKIDRITFVLNRQNDVKFFFQFLSKNDLERFLDDLYDVMNKNLHSNSAKLFKNILPLLKRNKKFAMDALDSADITYIYYGKKLQPIIRAIMGVFVCAFFLLLIAMITADVFFEIDLFRTLQVALIVTGFSFMLLIAFFEPKNSNTRLEFMDDYLLVPKTQQNKKARIYYNSISAVRMYESHVKTPTKRIEINCSKETYNLYAHQFRSPGDFNRALALLEDKKPL